MERWEAVLQKLTESCGLSARLVPVPPDTADGILCDDSAGKTVITVSDGGKLFAFEIDGVDRVKAALARECVSTLLEKTGDSTKQMRDYLKGDVDEKPSKVHVGKADHYVFALYAENRPQSVFEYLTAMSSDDDIVVDMGDKIIALCKKIDNDSDYQSAGEFALVLRENITEEIDSGVKIGVGGRSHGVSELPLYYSYAMSALINGAEYDPSGVIYSYKEYAFIKILSELSPSVMEKYVKTVLDKNYGDLLSDAELMTAADAFLKHSLNISEASRSMYVHRNTLIYRLDKIEKMTGLNIRNFNDAMTFRAAYLIYKMMK